MRWRAALATAGGAVASPAAHAHGGGVDPWVPVLLFIALAGLGACIFVLLLVGRGPMWKRAVVGIGWAVVDFLAWWALMYLAAEAGTRGLTTFPEAVGYAMIGFLALFTWILPVVLLIRGRGAGR